MRQVARGDGARIPEPMNDAACVRRATVEDASAVHVVRQRAIHESAAGLYSADALKAQGLRRL